MILFFKIGFIEINWVDIVDISFVTLLLYQIYKLMRGSVAVKVLLGLFFLYLIYITVNALELKLLATILGQFMGVGVIALIIVFQQEIRKFLLVLGKSTAFKNDHFFRSFSWKRSNTLQALNLSPVIEAAKSLSGSNTGALIVFAKSSEIRFYTESGDPIDAIVSKRLLLAIFNKSSPLHDGAVIISAGRVKAARCILPVSENENLPSAYGLRHRAALGMSEATDSVVLIISEETGQISIALNGSLDHNLTPQELRGKLNLYLATGNIKLPAKVQSDR